MLEKQQNPEEFRMPAIWEPHEGTWLAWPHQNTHPGQQLKLEKSWLEMTAVLHKHENVHIIVPDERQKAHVEHQLRIFDIGLENIDFYIIPTDDMWICDCGPLVVVSSEGKRAVLNFDFNGWGKRYPHDLDNQIPAIVAGKLALPLIDVPLTAETGFEMNGKGTLIATRSSIINPNRNPGKTQDEIDEILKKYLGVRNIIWMSGMSGDDPELGNEETDCHVDLCCRFVDESTIVYGWPDEIDEDNPFYQRVLKVYREELENALTESGKRLNLIPLPMPKYPIYSTTHVATVKHMGGTARGMLGAPSSGLGVYCGYLDWHVANGVVLIPIFGDENDERALKIIGNQFPGREIVGIDGRAIFEGGGLIHCVTKEQPATPEK